MAILASKGRTRKMEDLSREVRLVSRPNGASTHSNFEIVEVELQPLGSGEVRGRNTWMSVDPYMRGRMRDYESYLPPFQIGKGLEGMAVGVVRESNDPDFATRGTLNSVMGGVGRVQTARGGFFEELGKKPVRPARFWE